MSESIELTGHHDDPPPSDFEHDLAALLNRHNQETPSDTPDFILAHFLAACLEAWNQSTRVRDEWYGRELK